MNRPKLLTAFLCLLTFNIVNSRDFTYTYEGNTLTYTVVDEGARTCMTKSNAGYEVRGILKIPEMAFDGGTAFTVTAIDDNSFYLNKTITGSLVLPNTVTRIGNRAFAGCTGLNGSLTLPQNLTSIGNSAFSGCSELTGPLNLPNGVTAIGELAFSQCALLSGPLTLPNSVTTVGVMAFSGCRGFSGKLTLPNSLTVISTNSFSGCSRLTGELKIPNSVTVIEMGAFSGCMGFTSLSIPPTVTSIGISAFANCRGLEGPIVLPDGLKTIPGWMFSECRNIKGEIVIPEGVTSIGESAFQFCGGLTGQLRLPSDLKTIGKSAFFCCDGFTGELIIPSSVTSVGEHGLAGLKRVTNLTFPGNISLGADAFGGLSSVTGDLTLPSSWTDVKPYLFRNCGFNGSLIIPASIKSIYTEAFYGCNNFSDVKVYSPEPPEVIGYLFDSINAPTIPLFVPDGCVAAYKSTFPWSQFKNISVLSDVNVKVMDIKLDRSTLEIMEESTATLVASLKLEGGTYKTITWSSSNPSIATVDNAGNVTAISVGTTTITAVCGGLSANCTVTVTPLVVQPAKITLQQTSIRLLVEHTEKLIPTIAPTSATVRSVSWSSSNSTIASVSPDGTVTGLATGEAVITATTSNGLTATCTVTVIPWSEGGIEYRRVSGADMNVVAIIGGVPDSEGLLTIPEEVEFDGTVYAVTQVANSAFRDNGEIVKLVTSSSLVYIGEEAFSGCTGLIEVEVHDDSKALDCGGNAFKNVPVTTLYLGRNVSGNPFAGNDALTMLTIGREVTVINDGDFAGCTSVTDVTVFPSVPPALADSGFESEVYDNATLHVSDENSAEYQAADGWKNFFETVDFNEVLPESINLNADQTVKIYETGVTKLSVRFTPEETTDKNVTWRSNNTKVATVSANGSVTAVKAGEAVITVTSAAATAEGVTPTASYTVTVVPRTTTIDGIDYEVVIGGGDSGGDIAKVVGGIANPDGTLVIPAAVRLDGKKYDVAEIADTAFKKATEIESVVIPASVSTVGTGAFAGCSNLREVEAEGGDKLLECGDAAFKDAPIEKIFLGTDISGLPFAGNDKLTDLILGENVTVIDPAEFVGCTSIKSITVMGAVPPEIYAGSFDEMVFKNAELKVPEGNVVTYKTSGGWDRFTDILESGVVRVKEIEVDKPYFYVDKYATVKLNLIFTPEDATERTVVWSTSNPEVALVNSYGLVVAIAEGNAVITATTPGGLSTCCTLVVAGEQKPTGIENVAEEPDKVVVTTEGGSILAPEGSQVYDLSGRRVRSVGLRRGIYIVRTPGGKTVKLLVK